MKTCPRCRSTKIFPSAGLSTDARRCDRCGSVFWAYQALDGPEVVRTSGDGAVDGEGMTEDDVKMCNCAGCNRELLGESMVDYRRALPADKRRDCPPLVRGRILERPYCGQCLAIARLIPSRLIARVDDNPSQQNAIRHLEEGR